MAKHAPTVLSPHNYGKGKHHTSIWCILSLFYSIKFLPLFGKKNRACWNYGSMPVSIMNVIKLSTMSRGVPNNFLNKECKNKINYTRHIFEKKKKKKEGPISQLQTRRLIMKLLSKGISSNPVPWICWDLNMCQIIVICSHFNENSIIGSIVGHEITISLLVSYLFIILKKVKKIKERIKKVGGIIINELIFM